MYVDGNVRTTEQAVLDIHERDCEIIFLYQDFLFFDSCNGSSKDSEGFHMLWIWAA
jgi:hypothetical protein